LRFCISSLLLLVYALSKAMVTDYFVLLETLASQGQNRT